MVEHHCAHCRALRAGDFGGPSARPHYPPDLTLEPVHLTIDLHVDLEAQQAAGAVTITLEARADGARDLKLNLVDAIDVDVRDADDARAVSWSYDDEALSVRWQEPIAAGERRDLVIAYRVERPAAGLYFSKPTEAHPDDPWCAMTDHETERARHWLPSIDLPAARASLEFRLRAREDFTIVANGRLTEEIAHDDETRTAVWKLEQPCPSYLTCFAIGDLVSVDDGEVGGVPVSYYATSQYTQAHLRRSFGRTKAMLEWMTARLDHPFPYPKYAQIALPGIGGAMENISLVTWDDIFMLDETLALEWTWLLDQINVHEMAHSYFGDLVVCRDYAHAWLKESWATYMETCWLEDTYGEDEQRYDLYRNATNYFTEADSSYSRPLVTREFSSSWQMYDWHLYPGGACRMHTLRCELGDAVFWDGVRAYLKRFAFKTVETEDFRRVLEEVSGRSLVQFFDQWIYRAGYPHIKVTFEHDDDSKQGTFTITQEQAKGDDAKAFRLKTDVGWVIDGELRTRAVELTRATTTVIVAMAREPEQVRFDPRGKVLHKLDFNPGADKLRRQLTHAEDVVGRIQAAHELSRTGKRRNIQAIADAYGDEGFWGVRQQLAKALGAAGTHEAIEGLLRVIPAETDPMVLEAVFQAAAKYRDPRLADCVAERLRGDELPYRARAAAYEALGAQRGDAPLELLTEAAQTPTFSDFPQRGALRALASTRREELLERLLAWTEPGALNHRARAQAAASLAALARTLDPHKRAPATERLIDLLRDPSRPVHAAAARALGALDARSAIGALEQYKGTLSHQEAVDVDDIIRGLRGGETPKVTALEKQVESLRDTIRKLEGRLATVEARAEGEGD